jgi:TetR/AcrR family transcriptional repressor of mexJK operon
MDTSEAPATPAAPARRLGRPPYGQREARRAAVLDAAVGLFGQRGFTATSIEAVAAEAGVTKRTVYAHFTDKTGLFVAAVDRLHEHEHATDLPGADLLTVAARIVQTLHSDHAVTLHRLVIAEATHLPELAATFYRRGPAASIRALAGHLAAEPDGDPGRAETLYTLLLGEAHRQRLLGLAPAPEPAEAREHARRAIRTVLGAG